MDIDILAQPDDVTCGPTSLHAVYRYLGLDVTLDQVISEVHHLEEGGTLAVFLGLDALGRGFAATLYSYNLDAFDPSWWGLDAPELVEKLERQLEHREGSRFEGTTRAYQRFLRAGGRICFEDLDRQLLERYFARGLPILAGLSATYLYGSKREHAVDRNRLVFDDLKGRPTGHFVVLSGIRAGRVVVADPLRENPISHSHRYEVDVRRVLNAILLGIVTYDANLLIVAPASR
jgi:hypothetical protein